MLTERIKVHEEETGKKIDMKEYLSDMQYLALKIGTRNLSYTIDKAINAQTFEEVNSALQDFKHYRGLAHTALNSIEKDEGKKYEHIREGITNLSKKIDKVPEYVLRATSDYASSADFEPKFNRHLEEEQKHITQKQIEDQKKYQEKQSSTKYDSKRA